MTAGRNDFWSRRKALVEAEALAEEAEVTAEEQRAVEAAQADLTDEELLEELGLPDPDAMRPGDDFAAFMKAAVPDRLRRRALRTLWKSNPVLANLDGLVDHGEDFTDKATVVPGMATAYQVGKGMLKHVMAKAEEAALVEVKQPVEAEVVPVHEDVHADAELAPDDIPAEVIAEDSEPVAPVRHMQFHFPQQEAS